MVDQEFSIFLTGGKSIEKIYEIWCQNPKFQELNNINFYVGDERCVGIDNEQSNSGMIIRTLFKNGIPSGCKFFSPIIKGISYQEMAERYASSFPGGIDILLLCVGDDGHIASIFPGENAIIEKDKCFLMSYSPYRPFLRLTITLAAVRKAKNIYLLAPSKKKIDILNNVKNNLEAYRDLPVRHVIEAQWIASENIDECANLLLDFIQRITTKGS